MTEDPAERARHRRVETIFFDAIERPAPDRASFLAGVCGDDAGLRREVDHLLALDGRGDELLAKSPWTTSARSAVAPPREAVESDLAGAVVGPYRLVRRIGRGGMGDVWLAHRADESYRAEVAVKVIRRGLDTDDILERFRTERQVLASLRHPNIASLLDGGAMEDGRPFLVMEHVEGLPIDRHCDGRGLTVRERVRLFLQVCAAVQHAHRNLVIHRDLKPGNVLVDDDGAVKLLDFGIAKVLATDGADAAGQRTAESDRRLTPSYSSPEQVRGDVVTTASDVYSLGVVLYELLAGRSPYRVDPRSTRDLARAVCDDPPLKPVTAGMTACEGDEAGAICRARSTDRGRLQRELSGDVERILLKAIHKDPAQRYQTVEALSDDLRRMLDGFPVTARPDSIGYRARKFVERNRVGVAVAGLVAATVVTTAVVSSVLFVQARAARAVAEREKQTTLTINSYLTDLLTSVDPEVARGRDVTVLHEALDKTAGRLESELEGAPLVAAMLHRTVGDTYHAIAEYDDAVLHLRRAAALEEQHGLDARDRIATLLSLGGCLNNMNAFDEALRVLAQAQELAERHLPAADPAHGLILVRRGAVESDRGEYDGAEPMLRAGLERLRASRAEPADVAFALSALGNLLVDRLRMEEARPLLEEASALLREAYGELNPRIATIETELGWCARRSGDLDASLRHYEKALEIRRTIFDPDHDHIASSLVGVGAVLEDQGRFEEAEERYLEASDVLIASVGREHTQTGTLYNNLGGLYRKMNRLDAAVDMLEQAAAIYAAVRGPDDYFVSFARTNLAVALLDRGDHDRALAAADEALRIRRLRTPEEHPEIQTVRTTRGAALTGLGRFDEAERELLESHELLAASLAPGASAVTRSRRRIAQLYEAWGRPDDAAAWR